MATPLLQQDHIIEQEIDIMEKRRQYILTYTPPVWTSAKPDPVSGNVLQIPMVNKASIHLKHDMTLLFCFFLTYM